jgi:exonuclease III
VRQSRDKISQELKERIVAADIHDDMLDSDHCPVSLVLTL